MKIMFFLFLTCLYFVNSIALAEKREIQEDHLALWDYGIGLGFIRLEQYPAANQFNNLLLPFPAFHIREMRVRADNRDGAHVYFFKEPHWNLEMSGTVYPALDSSANDARSGMDNLPWLVGLGPQIVYKFNFDFRSYLGIFQAVTTDFNMTRFAGAIYRLGFSYQWNFESNDIASFGKVYFEMQGGSQEFGAVYYDVPTNKTTPTRPAYQARDGFLDSELGYFQSFRRGLATFYIGGALTDYHFSANRQSPLHKSDQNTAFLVGLTYVIGQSSKVEFPDNQNFGLIKRQ